jgi:hypothetical protein
MLVPRPLIKVSAAKGVAVVDEQPNADALDLQGVGRHLAGPGKKLGKGGLGWEA